MDALKRGANNLQDNPYMYEAWQDNPAYRKMSVNDYLVFYTVDDKTRTVSIHRVLHGARNIKDYLG